jgi:hypothetical protein
MSLFRSSSRSSTMGVVLALSLSALRVCAQSPDTPGYSDPQTPPPAAAKPADGKPADAKPAPPKPGALKPYSEVITAEAKSEAGVFTVHRIGEKVYYEIPPAMLNREMLWSTEIAELPAGFGYGGTSAGDRVVRWTRRNNKIYLRSVSYQIRADGADGAIRRAVEAASLEPIIMAFDVETESKDKAPVIEVTRLYATDVPEFSPKGQLGGAGLDPARSYIEKVKAFPTNIETRSLMTYTLGGPTPGNPFGGRGPRSNVNSVTALIHFSLTLLPAKPMQGRYFDSRVGYFTERYEDYGSNTENRVVPREYIARYRLEKKDPTAKLSEPVKPIVYYIGREVPEQWHSYIKQGVEDWQQAFEAAGYKNAIICKNAPTLEQDPDWDEEDARYSVIRWAPMAIENAMGPHIHDPRSGEIISAHIIVWHDVLKLAQTWYFTQVGDLDPRAQKLPLPESLMGELMRYVVSHEVGHTLGLRHNHKASSSYTCAQLRDAKFTEEYGDEASIMDYGRFNYVAQPGDNARLIPKLGPYDRFAIEWGYTPLPDAKNPEAEKPALDAIAARQVSDPMLRFGGEDMESQTDPSVQTEDLGSDPIEATTYGLKNIARIAQMLIPATTKYGEDYDLLKEMYTALDRQRLTELMHVLKLVGGVVQTDYHAGRGDAVFAPTPKAQQAKAVRFLLDNALTTPKDLILPGVIARVEPYGVTDRVLGEQRLILGALLSEGRVRRMLDNQALVGNAAYTPAQLVADVQSGVWSELTQTRPVIDIYRRNLQRAYLQMAKPMLVGDGATQSELRPILTHALVDLERTLDRAIVKTRDLATLSHLRDCRNQVDRILHPRV